MANEPIIRMFEEFPQNTEWDVVVIGGGPNGLMAAAYLAKSGLKVALVERRFEIGGGLATEELMYPCYSCNPHVVYHLMVDYMPVIRDFNLDGNALLWTKPNAQTAMVFEDGQSLMLTRMIEDTKDSILKFSQKDAVAFGRVMRTWRKIVDDIVAPATYVPPLSPIEMTMALQRTDIGREMLELVERSPLDIINDVFEDDHVRALILYTTCMWGLDPRETGLGFFVPLLLDRGMNKCYCYGGSHKFAAAMAREFVRAGGIILEAAEATKIIMNGRGVEGVEIGNEERTLRAKVVMSTLDPQTTFLDLVGPQYLPSSLKEAVEGWKYDKWSFYTLHIASEERPRYAVQDQWVNDSFMTVFGFNSTEEVLVHWDNVVAGKVGKSFGGHATCESQFDPHLTAKSDKHISFFQMHAPYEIEGGWDKRDSELQEAILAKWQEAAPNLKKERIVAMKSETPEDIAIRFPNMRRGGIKHGDYKPIQMGSFRPNQDCCTTKTPIEGLYVCGVSTYPGGLVLGGSGYLGANKVADDLGVTKWWKPTAEMDRFVKTYLT